MYYLGRHGACVLPRFPPGAWPRVDSAGAGVLEDTLQAFGKALSGHIRVEERVLFEQVQAALDEAELEALGDIVERETRRSCPSG